MEARATAANYNTQSNTQPPIQHNSDSLGLGHSIMTDNQVVETMDHVMPLRRDKRKQDYKVNTAKFEYEEQRTSTKETVKEETLEGKISKASIKEEVTQIRDKKVTLYVYSQSPQEDCEHFFEALERFKKEVESAWKDSSTAKANSAAILYSGMETMLAGIALIEWHDVIGAITPAEKTWEHFKTHVAEFITKKICPNDAYSRQRTYLSERRMPAGMEVHDYWIRIQTLNRYLPYLIANMEELKRWEPNSDFRGWWVDGKLSDQELRNIVVHRVPQSWQSELEKNDIGHTKRNTAPIEDLIEHYAVLQRLEKAGKRLNNSSGRIPYNRMNGRERGRTNNYGMNANRGSANSYRGRVWPGSNNYQRTPGRFVPYFRAQMNQSGGRGLSYYSNQGSGPYAGRGRTTQQGPRQQQRSSVQPGRWQQQRTNPSEAYYQEDQQAESVTEHQQEEDPNSSAVQDVMYTEDEIVHDWNEQFFLDDQEEMFALNEEPSNEEEQLYFQEDWRGFRDPYQDSYWDY